MKTFSISYTHDSISFHECDEIDITHMGNYCVASNQTELETKCEVYAMSYGYTTVYANYSDGHAVVSGEPCDD